MTKRVHLFGVGVAFLALLALLVFSLTLHNRHPSPVVAERDATALPSLGDPSELVDPERNAPERTAIARAEAAKVVQPHILVRGRIVAPVSDLETVQVGILGTCRAKKESWYGGQEPYRPWKDVKVDPAGRFEAEVTDMLDECPGSEPALLVVARHRLSQLSTVNLQPRVRPEIEDGESFDELQLITEVTLELQLGTLITGRVSVEAPQADGPVSLLTAELESFREPVRSGSRTFASQVQARAFEEGFPPWTYLPEDNSRVLGADGEFAVQVEPGARFAVVAAAPGLRPRTEIVDVLGAGLYRVDLTIVAGEELSGTLQIGPDLATAGMLLTAQGATEEAGAAVLTSEAGDLAWVEDGYEWARASAVTDAAGRFCFRGLAPMRYLVGAFGEGILSQHARSFLVGEYDVPASGVRLGPCLARVDLDLGTSDSGPISFNLLPSNRDSMPLGPFETDPSGRASVHLRPKSNYKVRVGRDDLGELTTGAAGEISSWRFR